MSDLTLIEDLTDEYEKELYDTVSPSLTQIAERIQKVLAALHWKVATIEGMVDPGSDEAFFAIKHILVDLKESLFEYKAPDFPAESVSTGHIIVSPVKYDEKDTWRFIVSVDLGELEE